MNTEVHVGIKILKGILYVLSRIAIVGGILLGLVVAYHTAVNTMTVNMVIKDAFAKRAQYILRPAEDGSDIAAMEKLFTEKAMERDEGIETMKYRTSDYTINEFYERTEISPHVIWSWQNEASVQVTEIVLDISATSNAPVDATGRRPAPDVPEWDNGVYRVRVVKSAQTNGWMIDDISFISRVIAEAPGPDLEETPDDAGELTDGGTLTEILSQETMPGAAA